MSCVRYFADTCTPSVPILVHIAESPGHVLIPGVSGPLLLKAITKCGVGKVRGFYWSGTSIREGHRPVHLVQYGRVSLALAHFFVRSGFSIVYIENNLLEIYFAP